jgi:hypothetical protein
MSVGLESPELVAKIKCETPRWMFLVKTVEFLSLFFVLRFGSEDKPSWPGGLCQKCRLGIFKFEVLWIYI